MVDDIGKLAGFIQQYGPLIVILAVFLLLFLTIFAYTINANKKAIESDREMNKQLVTSILNDYFAKTAKVVEGNKNYDEKNIVNIFVKLNKALKNVCELTCKKTNSDRTAIYVFHNGSQASHGLPFFKLTCISEWVSKNSNSNIKMAEHTALPLNLFDNIIQGLYENSEYRIILDKSKDPGDMLFLKNTKIKDCFFIPIYDDDNNMMGFIFNGYNTVRDNIDIEKEKESLADLAKTAKPVIEFSKCQDYKSEDEKEY